MLAEERMARIKERVNEQGSATLQELMEYLETSESTIRRDIVTLDSLGEVMKVHGGAVSVNTSFQMRDDEVKDRRVVYLEEKRRIAKYAAGLVKRDDFVYIDAGTTTELIMDYLTEKNAIYVTNAVSHGCELAHKGFQVYLVGGRLKGTTEAVVGAGALEALSDYNFTMGFWGTNGIHKGAGFTTPDKEEAGVKHTALRHCKNPYILADASKFDSVSPVKFAGFEDALIITDKIPEGYQGCDNIILVNKDGKEEET